MGLPGADLAGLPGAPESRLAAALLASLGQTPTPPWSTRVRAVVWWHRATPAAVAALPVELRRRVRLPIVVGAFVRYVDSPVGAYEEVLAGVVYRPLQVHVPFIAVDSVPSVHAGRAHWALPKTLAAFERGEDVVTARGQGWEVAARVRLRSPRLPAYGRVRVVQPDACGSQRRAVATARGSARLARVDVEVASDLAGLPASVAGWLLGGHHAGLELSARLRVGAPARPATCVTQT